jgi:hypothetical protein
MEMLYQARHDVLETRSPGIGEAGDHSLSDVVLIEVSHGSQEARFQQAWFNFKISQSR